MTDPKPSAKRNVSATIPTELAQWVAAQAAREARTQAVVIARAIATYRIACEAQGLDKADAAAALPLHGSAGDYAGS